MTSGAEEALAIVRRHFIAEEFHERTGHHLARDKIIEVDEAALTAERDLHVPYDQTASWFIGVIANKVKGQL